MPSSLTVDFEDSRLLDKKIFMKVGFVINYICLVHGVLLTLSLPKKLIKMYARI